jgi:hypothetical protein
MLNASVGVEKLMLQKCDNNTMMLPYSVYEYLHAGKILNVRQATHKQKVDNKEIQAVFKILGLEHGANYETLESRVRLLLPVLCFLLSAVCSLLFAVCCLVSALCYLLSFICSLLSACCPCAGMLCDFLD